MSNTTLFLDKFYHFEKTQPTQVYLRQPLNRQYIEFTWAEVGREARKLATRIKAMNLPERSCIALMSKNCAHWIITDLAIFMAGHISVPLYPTLKDDSIKYVLEHSEAKLVFIGKLDEWEKQKGGVPEDIPKVSFPFWHNEGTQNWDEFLGNSELMMEDYKPNPKDVATIIYTSGTTGKPKGVVHTFHSMSFPIIGALNLLTINNTDRFISYLPLSHVAERILIELGSICTGGTISFAESLDTFKEDLQNAEPTLFLAVPRIWLKFQQGILAKLPQKKLNIFLSIPILSWYVKKKIRTQLGLGNAKFCFTGAAAISKDLLNWFDRLGIPILEVYGMTENFAITSMNVPDQKRYGTVGKIFPDTECKIADNGEILHRSDAVMQGYYKREDVTSKTINADGWLHTGDKGDFDSDGYLKITGRVKDLFKTSKGKYIAPNAIESHFSMCDLVEQVCVVGEGMPQPIALVVLSEIGLSLNPEKLKEEIANFFDTVNNKIESFEKLNNIVILKDEWSVETGILTPTLKIKRNIVEEKYGSQIESWFKQETVLFA